ncbi:hypothetical protein [Brevundimonas sp.]|jgi:hypothetical protein|uniref:hypothetical protein n=1 Tax=Brevundimonas sp. TaxID=1871086 RepID=UPI002E153669|nr:hypothetical protein [Brevundimonas sp.]
MEAERSIEVHALHWRGVDLEITFEESWLGMAPSRAYATAHLTVTATSPERAKLPITETGFRSHFIRAEDVAEVGGPVAYVTAWLDHMARSREWIAYEQASRQLSLF